MKFDPAKFFRNIPRFFSEVKKEMKKVTWPTRNETISKTLLVIGISVVTAAVLGGLDAFFTWVVRTIVIK